MKFQFRLSEQRDGDIIYWLNHTEDKSEAIRSAIRAAIEKEEMVSKALEEMTKAADPATQIQQAISDIKFEMSYANVHTFDEVKEQIGWMYPEGVLGQAWREMHTYECNAKNDSNTLDALDPCKEMNNNAETV